MEYLGNEIWLRVEIFCLLIILPLTFSQVKICWNKRNTLHTQIKIWHLEVWTWLKFINIALVVLKIFKVVKYTTFSMSFDTNKPDVNRVKGKNGRVHQIIFLRLAMTFLSFAGNPCYICLKTYYSIDPFYHAFLKKFLIYA